MLLLATCFLHCALLPQQEEPVVLREAQQSTAQEPTPPADSKRWWDEQTPEHREEMRKRMEAYRNMPEEARAEMERRRDLVKQERKLILKNLSEEDRATYEALDKREQRRFLDERLRARLEAQGKELRTRFPGAEELGHNPDLHERFRESRRFLTKERGEQIRQEIQKAVDDGWLGERTAIWLANAGVEESMAVLGEIRKWQFMEQAAENGLWEGSGIDEQQRLNLLSLPAPEFFREVGNAMGWRHGKGGRRHGGEGRPPRDGEGRPPHPPGPGGERGGRRGPPPQDGLGPPREGADGERRSGRGRGPRPDGPPPEGGRDDRR